jgi:hypothetical protein
VESEVKHAQAGPRALSQQLATDLLHFQCTAAVGRHGWDTLASATRSLEQLGALDFDSGYFQALAAVQRCGDGIPR